MGVSVSRVVSGDEGTLSAAAKSRTSDITAGIDSLKPELREAILLLPLEDGIGWLSERVAGLAANLYAEHRRAPGLAEAVKRAAEMVVEEYGKVNRLAEKANDQYSLLHEALGRSIREELVEYGMECLRDRYVGWLSGVYADEVAGKNVKIVAGVPGSDVTALMPLDPGTAGAIAHRSFCVVSESRAVLVTLDGSKNFFLRVGKRSNTTIASQAFDGGSIVERHTPDIAAAFRHVAELRYFANNIVAEHQEFVALAETYMAYTAKLSADIEREMGPDMEKSFPLYASWKNIHRPGNTHVKRAKESEGVRDIEPNALTGLIDRSVGETREALLSMPIWIQLAEDGEWRKIRKMKLAYTIWYASHAKREVSAAIQDIDAKLGKLGMFAKKERERLSVTRGRIVKIQEELDKMPRAATATAPAKSDTDPSLDPNFVQAICDHQVREWLRQESFKPFFDKINKLYSEDPTLGSVTDEWNILIPSRRHVKIANLAEKRGYRHEGYAGVRPAGRGMTPLLRHVRGSRLSAGEFARLIALSMAEFLRETEWGHRKAEFSRAFERIVTEEVATYFGKLPDDDKLLHDTLTDTYRIHNYHPKHDAEEDETKTNSPTSSNSAAAALSTTPVQLPPTGN